jgi:biotin synthase
MSVGIRYDWQKTEIQAIYNTPLLELIYQLLARIANIMTPNKYRSVSSSLLKQAVVPKIVATALNLPATKQKSSPKHF